MYDNPAGRLHARLAGLAASNVDLSLAKSWCAVLDVARLIPDLESSVQATGDDAYIRSVHRHRAEWARQALDHISAGGPAAVRFAIEALFGNAVMSGAVTEDSGEIWKKVFTVLGTTYAAFTAGPTLQAALEAWPHVIHLLGAG
ncbi:MAG TPA: hypothetical protein VHX62_17020 [Solirubrobacteraceae bacterium]|nr:hypothetical protein [Solirubrobacteraceae bacterium]